MPHLRSRHRVGLVALAASCAFAAPAGAATGQLEWTMLNDYQPSVAAPGTTINRTWLGYLTNPTPGPGSAKGTTSAVAPATGPTITPQSPRGANVWASWDYAFTGTGSSGTTYTGSDTFAFEGTVRFVSPTNVPGDPTSGHGFTVSLENPRIVFSGGSGQLFASGVKAGAPNATPIPYADDQPIFTLDLSAAQIRYLADGSQVITCMAPRIATAGHVFPANYPVDSGPERKPNTFGTLSVRLSPDAGAAPANWAGDCVPGPKGDQGVKGDTGVKGDLGTPGNKGDTGLTGATGPIGPVGLSGPVGPVGPAGAAGEAGPRGRTGARGPRGPRGRTRTVQLSRAPLGARTRAVTLTRRRTTAALAKGTVRGRTLRYTAARKVTGTVVLRSTGRRPVTVTLR
jgi:hypothetical protein